MRPETLTRRWYVVLEEMVDDVALLRRWPWPRVDQLGRLVWPDGGEHDTDAVTIDIERLRTQLYLPNRILRVPRVGDTFCVAPPRGEQPRWRNRHVRDLRTVFPGDVYDVSADAREAAKLAYQAGLAAVIPPGKVDSAERTAGLRVLRVRATAPLRRLRVGA